MKKLSLTTTALTALAGSALLTGVAFASDAMRSNDIAGGNAISMLARTTTATGEEKGDLISTAAKAVNDRAADVDKDKTEDVDVDKDMNADVDKDNDEATENDVDNDNDVDSDNDEHDQTKADTDNDDHGQAVASTHRHGDRHSNRGR